MEWNYGDLLDGCGEVLPPETPALIHGDRTLSWGELTARSNNLARGMLEMGAVPGDKVAIYLRNCAEYMEAAAACYKARLVPVNVNYRYRDDELYYILDNSDAVISVHGAEFRESVASLTPRLPALQWLEVGSSYDALAALGDGSPLEIKRSGEDMLFIYTGGTTGMPKAVMWQQQDMWRAMGSGALAPCNNGEAPVTLSEHMQNLSQFPKVFKQLTACPLMHGTGFLTSMGMLVGGGCIVTLTSPGLDSEELWQAVQDVEVDSMIIVGDAFAKPMLRALDENPGRWDISSVGSIISSGVMWSPEVKQGLLGHNKAMVLLDAFGSSEAIGFGTSVTTSEVASPSAKFMIGEECKVFNEDNVEVVPGSGESGMIARAGAIPMGYYKDPEKSAKTFPVIDGVRYSIPGDSCTVDLDGTINLLGRGSGCINSGGEKIFPEEVEQVLKTHPDIEDALVLGMADEKWGQAVTAVISVSGAAVVSLDQLKSHVRQRLADYKVPKAIYEVETMFRAPNGKADYKAAKAHVESAVSGQ
jgi:acyl-CoA synthetase (AMP-forming)/AMP-acid ligase II